MPTNEELYQEYERLKDAGQMAEAASALEQLVAQDPEFALAHSALAVLYGRLNRHADAIRHGLKVCELEPNDPFSFTAMSVTFQRAGKIPEAEDAMARARMLQAGTDNRSPETTSRAAAGHSLCGLAIASRPIPSESRPRRSCSARSRRSRRCRDAWRRTARAPACCPRESCPCR